MTGRLLNRTPAAEIAKIFATANPVPNYAPRYNLAPPQDLLVVRFSTTDGKRYLEPMRWGLIPLAAKDRSVGSQNVNARAEVLTTQPAFRDAFAKRRCLIPADGYYEWQDTGAAKLPYVVLPEGQPHFAFAGLWERWNDPVNGETVRSCAIITCPANPLLAPIVDRMPVILDKAGWARWLGEKTAVRGFRDLLKPFPPERLKAYRVGNRVNSTRYDDAALIDPEGAG